jgi:predicted nucleic acid-binding protein
MLVLDNNLLSDYLNGVPAAAQFLVEYEQERWAVSSIVLYEAFIGSLYDHIDVTPEETQRAVTTSMEILEVTGRTASEGMGLQRQLLERGEPVNQLDALIAGSAVEHGATFATAEKQFWNDAVQSVLSVAEYDPH